MLAHVGGNGEIRTLISQLSVVTVYKTAALPLSYVSVMALRAGPAPATPWLTARCSTD